LHHLVGLGYALCSCQPELGYQPVLKGAPQPLYPPSGLRRVRWYGGDAQLFQQAAKLCRLSFAHQLLLQRLLLPGWCLEYAVAISVSFPRGRTMSGYYVLQQQEIALGILLQSKESIGHFTRGIINGTYKG